MDETSNNSEFLTEEEIRNAIRSVALGTAKRSHEIKRRTESDGAGGAEEQVKEAHVDPPNISLLMKLMENRIGGPQDYC